MKLPYPLFGALLAISLSLLVCQPLRAGHIVGGELTYECLGGGDYEFSMTLYRDCNCSQCAQYFDDFASIAIYQCNPGDCFLESQNAPWASFSVPLLSDEPVATPDYPCLIEPNLCVREGKYKFRLSDFGIVLPPGNQSYHISYQRCCRNVTINNLIDPGSQGATWTVELLPASVDSCNSSPVFDEFPPTVVCGNFPLEFDHSATDPDGDSLVYSFCAPFQGGGPITGEPIVTTCSGAVPTPACPPPYKTVEYVTPTYSQSEPMLGNPVVKIDPETGIITGTPNVEGQFVVGVCVEEYRDGQLLGRIVRDFQFNVEKCDPTVIAKIRADEEPGPKEFEIRSCGENTIAFINESFQQQYIEQTEWSFADGTDTIKSTEFSPSITFPGVGTYVGQMMLNRGTPCSDSAYITVNIYPEISADFEFDYDTCVSSPVMFTDLSWSGSGLITDWNWDFGDGNNSQVQNPQHFYADPIAANVQLTVIDSNLCEAVAERVVPYYPLPDLILLGPGPFVVCEPAQVFFDNLSAPINELYETIWDFGDGQTDTALSPLHTYETPGDFTVNLDITTPLGCFTDTTFSGLVTVLPSPDAGYSYTPTSPSNINPTVNFQDASQGAQNWLWDFDTGDRSPLPSPTYTFPDTGVYEVMQIVTHPSGCTDTIVQRVDVVPEVRYHLPNAFTPNGDGLNDTYFGKGVLPGISSFELTIWNRWGEKVFQTSDPDQGWNGRYNNTGRAAPNDVYPVLVSFVGPRGRPFQFKGFATVVR